MEPSARRGSFKQATCGGAEERLTPRIAFVPSAAKAADQMGLSHKNFYGGRARIYKQYVARGNANCIGDLTLANFVNFQKNFFL